MKITDGKRVRLKVKLQVKGGKVLEESVVEYFHGAGTMLSGLEAVLEDLEVGAKKSGVIPAKDAFGAAQHQHTKEIPRSEFPEEAKLEVGAEMVAGSEAGVNVILKVEKIGDDVVTCKLLHPLHSKDIEYDCEVLRISSPTPPPLPVEAIAKEVAEREAKD